ncbi:hypothetical protein HD806DRAFT_531587 [Xylariaceae sp. AK1471]|nr:hypothetical protein HD806DRAFT_531587 [Xylariaceae sp. AK1471]
MALLRHIALRLAGDNVSDTYLNTHQILELARSASVDAIIPGYGFLSENADFARSVEQAGIIWIGPTPDQMLDIGFKHRARDIATEAGLPTIPGSDGLVTSLEHAPQEAERTGYPIMMKGTAGGGAALESAQRRGAANFSDSGILLERFILNARHVEVQIIGDGIGRVLALGDRDCTLQRRHQKVIEEAPALLVSAEIRARMRLAAITLAKLVKYRSVGTVALIYDIDARDFYFFEVNTRLQVEHPVTEAVIGLDLVQCMLDIAQDNCDELFAKYKDNIPTKNIALEARIYAEDPLREFRLCAGQITEPQPPPDIRLQRGLAATRVEGIQTNLEYLRRVVASSKLQSVVDPGGHTTVQDYPGRVGFWSIGVPPSGPMDHLSLRLANWLVHTKENWAGLECTLTGSFLKFHYQTLVAITDSVRQTLSAGTLESGYHVYIVITGGINVPRTMGSRATFDLAELGGYNGIKLEKGDILSFTTKKHSLLATKTPRSTIQVAVSPQPKAFWRIGVMPGPHGAPDIFTVKGLSSLFSNSWSVSYNSSRMGIRLKDSRPQWTRANGGEVGLHPSNIHDTPYSIGSVSFAGDEAVVLTCDGPSLGGFAVFCMVASAAMWKLVGDFSNGERRVIARRAGDCAILLEFGDAGGFNMRESFEIYAFVKHYETNPIPGIQELTPGVCSIYIKYPPHIFLYTILSLLEGHIKSYPVPTQIKNRLFRLPFVFGGGATRAAVQRYAATIRPTAPWLPSKIGFLEELNSAKNLQAVIQNATFLVLGLGDVFLGLPCAMPLDPRYQLFGTKYNPSRSFTPKSAERRYLGPWLHKSKWWPGRVREPRDNGVSSLDVPPTRPYHFLPRTGGRHIYDKAVKNFMHIEDGRLDIAEYEGWLKRNEDDIKFRTER